MGLLKDKIKPRSGIIHVIRTLLLECPFPYPEDEIKHSRRVPCKLPFALVMALNPNIVAAMVTSGNIPIPEPGVGHDEKRNNQRQEKANKQGNIGRNGPMLTPEATPEPENARIDADRRGREQEKKPTGFRNETMMNEGNSTAQEAAQGAGAAEAQNSENSSAEQDGPKAEVLKEILSHPPQAFHKILGIPEDYDDKTQESRAVETAVYNRGTQVHPKHNKDRDAQEAWDSKQLLPAFRLLNAD